MLASFVAIRNFLLNLSKLDEYCRKLWITLIIIKLKKYHVFKSMFPLPTEDIDLDRDFVKNTILKIFAIDFFFLK